MLISETNFKTRNEIIIIAQTILIKKIVSHDEKEHTQQTQESEWREAKKR